MLVAIISRMKQAALKSLPGIAAGFCLADFAVLFYGQW